MHRPGQPGRPSPPRGLQLVATLRGWSFWSCSGFNVSLSGHCPKAVFLPTGKDLWNRGTPPRGSTDCPFFYFRVILTRQSCSMVKAPVFQVLHSASPPPRILRFQCPCPGQATGLPSTSLCGPRQITAFSMPFCLSPPLSLS